MFRTQSREMRNLSATNLRPPLIERIFVTFPFNKLHRDSQLLAWRGAPGWRKQLRNMFGHGSVFDSRMSAIVRRDEQRNHERPCTARGSMLVTNEDSVNCVHEHAVVTCI